ncbi:GH92 family glycosyl hydrolase [Occallatibacter riparius]|uniref:GH92 family glycosyl hydrolase n=1 Tax=Occallatibacter riparius TaxID=1002689 RepID=A0A9J7BNJ7_9BACT|nr:GH92 family glycosyl hydrolase [Occallatibacter riparius]UWZ82486.1 GH92 family glycosyl hydrolase [Occallatibacter riparius]
MRSLFLRGCVWALVALWWLVGVAVPASSQSRAASPYDSVDTRIGTAGGGNTFPGATLPFGMVQWSPDTNQDAWYKYDEKTILGFSLTHISGAGCPVYGDFGVLPVTGELTTSPDKDLRAYEAAFDHAKEETHPGYYAVTLANGVRVELTVSDRAGIARFTFPEGVPARLLVNAGSSWAQIPSGSKDFKQNGIALNNGNEFSGFSRAGHFCGSDSHYIIYALGQFNKRFTKTAVWKDEELMRTADSALGKQTGAWLDFGNAREVILKVGVSFASNMGALNNLDGEIPAWDFDQVRAKARTTWSELLDRFAVEGGTDEQRKIYYTGVYHSFLSPNLFSDVDGRYIGFDKKVRTVSGKQKAQYANFSDWDIYRNTVQLQALFEPEREGDMMQSLVNDAEQGGQLPRWEAANDVTYVMGGDSPAPVIASSYAFGARDFDAKTALKWMVTKATQPKDNKERPFLENYLKLGYVTNDEDALSASRTLEYASDDFAISRMAESLGDKETANRFRNQSRNWKNLIDPETKWIRPRNADGTWLAEFDAEKSTPKRKDNVSSSDQAGFEEGNTWQYSFMVPFDYPALFDAMGGKDAATARLDRFFTKLRCWGEPCYNIENEPDFVVPYAYVWAGQPWKTQKVVTRIGATAFKATPDGIPGNDDLGATSGVYVWGALGMYPAVPGVGGVVLGTPMFAKAALKMTGGRTLEVTRHGDGVYVSSVKLNGERVANYWIPIAKLHTGLNRLEFSMQATPDTKPEMAAPPSF